jgi:hypothetical protein
MTKIFTQDDILRYVYKETTPQESGEIETALLHDKDLYFYFKQILQTVQDVNRLEVEPSERSIQNILKYSRSTASLYPVD